VYLRSRNAYSFVSSAVQNIVNLHIRGLTDHELNVSDLEYVGRESDYTHH